MKTFKNFEKATKRDTVDCCFGENHFEKDKIPTAEIDNGKLLLQILSNAAVTEC